MIKKLSKTLMFIRKYKTLSSVLNKNEKFGQYNTNKIHITLKQKYPLAASLPIPANINVAETTKFSPQRSRDISAIAISSHQSNILCPKIDATRNSINKDPHVDSYDCFGIVSLNSAMQSNVPCPFPGMNKLTHLNMPGGQWAQDSKFMSYNLQNSHYTNLSCKTRIEKVSLQGIRIFSKISTMDLSHIYSINDRGYCLYQCRYCSSENHLNDKENMVKTLSKKEQLKKMVKEYGTTVFVFHIGMSLICLQICYLLVSSGVDMNIVINFIGLGSNNISNKIATNTSTFVVAYTIYKVFAPLRISITLVSAPFIVRYLRTKGFLKPK